jgi:peptidoglycan/LPS O-acetylase OafA/YrhL
MTPLLHRVLFDPALVIACFLLALALCGALVAMCDRMGGSFAAAVNPHPGKLAALEGLRGVLALAVVVHHACCWFWFVRSGVWSTQGSIIFERLAPFGVMQFFFISGFLFWRKLMSPGSIKLRAFYVSRFVRLAPVYYLCVGTAILIALWLGNFHIVVSARDLSISLASWLFFSIAGQLAVNGVEVLRIVCGVVWTLGLEWCFYLSLPFLGWFSGRARRLIYLALICGLLFLVCKWLSSGAMQDSRLVWAILEIREFAKFMIMGFGGGILVAALQTKVQRALSLSVAARSAAVAVLYAIYLLVPDFPGFQTIALLVLLAAFALVVQGADLFGFLTSRSVRFLGAISYDLYLVHGIVYFLAIHGLDGSRPIPLANYIAQTAGCLATIIGVSTVLHFAVERPSMRVSERIARAASPRRAAPPELAQR